MPKGKPYPAEFKAKVTLGTLHGACIGIGIASAYELVISELLSRI